MRPSRPLRHGSTRRAFTLLEVVVALAVSGLVLLGGRLLFESLSGATRTTIGAALDADRVANGERLLRSLAGRIEVGTDHAQHFGGDDQSVHFTTWCDTPAGWLERCEAALQFELDNKPELVMHLKATEPHSDLGPRTIVVASGFRRGALRYLNDPRAGGQWFVRWGEAITAPLALAIVLDGEASIIRIGERG